MHPGSASLSTGPAPFIDDESKSEEESRYSNGAVDALPFPKRTKVSMPSDHQLGSTSKLKHTASRLKANLNLLPTMPLDIVFEVRNRPLSSERARSQHDRNSDPWISGSPGLADYVRDEQAFPAYLAIFPGKMGLDDLKKACRWT